MPMSATATGGSLPTAYQDHPKPAKSEVADVAKALILACLQDGKIDREVRCELAKWVINYRYDLRD